ncbi:MAG: TonB family protein [Polyangiaceae bacterium]|nr:TonB family protein [Polyangiaceae bacterium]
MSRRTLLFALSALLGAAPFASAEPAPTPVVTMPSLTAPIEAPYPEGATGSALVELELVIDSEGRVTSVRVISGQPPFSVAAVAAAEQALFEPARRGDQPVAARVRVRLAFAPPSQPQQPQPVARSPRAPAPPEPDAVIEVVVEGERRPPAVVTFTRAEVRELPGSFGDPFRAIEAMPGVTPIVSGVPYFFVRGAPPGNVGYFLDGIRVPLLYHVGLGPSVVHPGIVERVDLYPGGYPARFGRFAGGIVSGETSAPRPELHGEASVRLVDAGALLEAPFASGRGTALAGGRYSYTGLLISLFSPDAVLEYWDYQARASYDVSAADTLSVFSFGAYDFLGEKRDSGTRTLLSSEFHRVDLRWQHRASPRTTVNVATTVGLDRTAGEEEDLFVRDRLLSSRAELRHRSSPQLELRAGADVGIDHYDVASPLDDGDDPFEEGEFRDLFPPRTDLATGVHVELGWRPEPWLTVTPGLRVDLYASDGAAAIGVDPRLSARYELSERVRLLHAFGIAHQPPSFVVPVPGLQVSDLRGGLQRSLQSSAGVEADLPAEITGSLVVFQNAFFGMTDALGASTTDDEETRFDTRSLGRTVGVEVFLKRALTRQLGGFLSYTLSRSTRSLGRSGNFAANFDRTHVLNLALAGDLGRRWRAGGRFVFYTGFPNRNRGDEGYRRPDRIPPFHRFDVRVEKRWRLGKTGSWAAVLEVLNTTLQREVVDVRCYSDGCENEEIGPVTIPSLGVEAMF